VCRYQGKEEDRVNVRNLKIRKILSRGREGRGKAEEWNS